MSELIDMSHPTPGRAGGHHDALAQFHPLIQRWFRGRLGTPSDPQRLGWPLIAAGRDVLIAAPTGSGKTLTAFLACLDELLRAALAGRLEDETSVVYVSPLKALGNDVQRNLLQPLSELLALAESEGLSPQPVRVQVRSGDTPSSERAAMVRRPPHILITTPESLFLYLTAARSRETLRKVKTVIVDEIHALARDKRGAHFALSMQRLEALTSAPPQLVGLSATQKPLEVLAAFLGGSREPGPELVRVGHLRPWDLRVETPEDELSSVATHEMWGQIYDRIVALAGEHRTLLVFANTRRLAERVAHDLGLRLGEEHVAAHHGSMSREMRLSAESRLKDGRLRVMVATASLELGIDIGSVDLVCQLGSPRSISAFLQRVGRAGHRMGGVSKGVLFATTRDELVEAAALVRAVRRGELDTVRPPEKPLDVLAQQIVAEAACEDCDEGELFERFRKAWPYRELAREEFDRVLAMLSDGFALRRGHARALLHRDRVNGRVRARRGARTTALTNAGTIPDSFQYRVLAEPEERMVGTVDEDFATESMAGDVFLLGSTAWRVRRVSQGVVRVEDAKGQAPNVPFWRAEAPSRTDELSAEVSRLREEIARAGPDGDGDEVLAERLAKDLGLDRAAAATLVAYVRTGAAALGGVPTQGRVFAERFFDESGGMQLILHAPFGGRINRAWGLALRKRFCRIFDFELQAAATDDGILLSLGEQHSFPLAEIFEFLSPETVEDVLTQAILQIPIFATRFRWAAGRALALERVRMGRRVPPHLQRARNEDLLAAVFPAQVGCQDNRAAEAIEVPEHPLIEEALRDCLRDNMDIDGLKRVLRGIKSGRIQTRAVDLPGPSPFAHQFLNSQPYTFLDDAPLEERRARAVSMRRTLSPEDAAAFGALDPAAIDRVVADAQPVARDPDELHDALLQLGVAREEDVPGAFLDDLLRGRRACRVVVWQRETFLVAAERLPVALALFPDAPRVPELQPLAGDAPVPRDRAALAVVRGHMEITGPTTAGSLSRQTGVAEEDVTVALHRLESEGVVLRGQFRPAEDRAEALEEEWCDRRLLQRIHRLTLGKLRAEIEPLNARDFMRFLFRWHHLEPTEGLQGRGGLKRAISLLQGFEAPASAWEQALIRPRMRHYVPDLLDIACWSGEAAWGRLTLRDAPENAIGPARGAGTPPPRVRRSSMPGRNARLTFARREDLEWLLQAARGAPGEAPAPERLSHAARDVAAALERRGASFFVELVSATRRLPSEVEDALWELLARGLITADAVENLRVLQLPAHRRRRGMERGGPGRWSLLRPLDALPRDELLERLARMFLDRYGIVWRDLVVREPLAPPWWELLRVYRRLEARGEIRGGRFVSGFAGEQFALADAVQMAREVRRAPLTGARLLISAVDPLNLTGIVTPGPRVPAVAGNVVAYVDGVPQASARPGVLGPERPPMAWEEAGPAEPAWEAGAEPS